MPVPAIVLGLTLAFALALPPSVILTETIRRGARGGFWPGVAVQYGSIVADCVYALLGLTGAAILVTNTVIQVVVGTVGIGFMVFLGITGLRTALRADPGTAAAPREHAHALPDSPDELVAADGTAADDLLPAAPTGRLGAALAGRGPFLVGLALGLANPWAIAFWLGIGGTFAAAGLVDATAVDYATFFAAYVLGLSIYSISVAAIVGIGHRRLERRWLRIAEGAASAALLVFAAVFAVRVADLVPGLID
jgi:threonine/homoserine/homoserine lactone efflux protein